jgi:hypothetical protein
VNAPITIGFANVGRGSNGADHDAIAAMFAAMPERRWAILWCEINEGDRNNELALAKRLAPKGTRWYCQASREPIALSPDWPRAHSRVVWVPNTAVTPKTTPGVHRGWSPPRSINLVHLPGENTVLIGGHPAAGAYHGDRPAAARKALVKSWDKTFATHRLIETALHGRGKNVAWLMDVNRVSMPDVVGGEREVFADVTDHGRVLAAPGWAVETKYLGRVPFHVDSHDGHRMRVRFSEKD